MAGVKGRSGGWNRKSRDAHVLSGTFRRDRHGPLAAVPAPVPPSVPPPPPAGLSPASRKAWARYMNEYQDWSVGDLLLLELALQAQERAESCRRRLKAEGLVLRGPRGALRVHPLVRVEKAALDFAMNALKQLGLAGGRNDA